MKESVTLAPPNSLIFAMDHKTGVLPEHITAELVAATESCVAIGTLSAPDGQTTITLTDDLQGLETGELVFDGVLHTPDKELSVCSALNEKLLTMPVPATSTKIKVYANHPSEPDQIVIFAKP